MNTAVATSWYPDRVLRFILGWSAVLGILFWLPLIRSTMDGASYRWGLGPFTGQGLHGDLWFLILGLAAMLLLLYGGWRGTWPAVSVLVLLLVHMGLTIIVSYVSLTDPGNLRVQGDTLGIDLSLALLLPLLLIGLSALMIFWLLKWRTRAARPVPWTRANRVMLAAAVLLLPIQYALLREPNGATDPYGVLLTIVQWIVIVTALRPFRVT